MARHYERLRRLSSGESRSVGEVLLGDVGDAAARTTSTLDARTIALLRIAALIALDGPGAAYDGAVAAAMAAGATPDDIVETMLVIGPIVGSALLVSAAAKVAMAIGFDPADVAGE